tara:strand:- start:398 stop:586 length:189 start_codon:yes stop_codon:yes gene_type:complete
MLFLKNYINSEGCLIYPFFLKKKTNLLKVDILSNQIWKNRKIIKEIFKKRLEKEIERNKEQS